MSTFTLATRPGLGTTLKNLVERHPLAAYLVLAFVGTWGFFLPLVLSQQGAKVLPYSLPDIVALALFLLATYTGPFLGAFIVTALTSGRAGVRQLAGRIVQWRVGVQWYALVLLGYPLVFLVGVSPWYGLAPFQTFVQQWPLYFTVFLPAVLVGLIVPSMGEETGWRGFALPRLQASHGPLIGSLILGVIHAVWHFPVYFIPGAVLPNGFDLTLVVANSAAITLSTLVWTWLFNGAGDSVFFAMLVHATSNATSGLLTRLLPSLDDPWMVAKIMAVVALIVVVATQGRLGYRAP